MADNTSGPNWWDPRTMEPAISDDQKALFDKFVDQYLIDFDEFKASLRMGLLPSVAATYCKQIINEGYVQREIARRSTEAASDPKAAVEHDRELMLTTLRWAMQHGPSASRVQAARAMAAVHGFERVKKEPTDSLHRGGVMRIPEIANVDDWEAEAEQAQERLLEETQKL